MYLTPNTPNLIDDYVSKYAMSDVGIFTCFTNRVGNREQVYANSQRDNDEITTWIKVATALEHQPMKVKQLKTPISGMLMVIAREVATKIKFNEDLKCLGVDTDFSQRVLDAGYSILRMDTVLVWHTYRLLNGVNNKKHLV
jgi:GT2 family glycosyltransferase